MQDYCIVAEYKFARIVVVGLFAFSEGGGSSHRVSQDKF